MPVHLTNKDNLSLLEYKGLLAKFANSVSKNLSLQGFTLSCPKMKLIMHCLKNTIRIKTKSILLESLMTKTIEV